VRLSAVKRIDELVELIPKNARDGLRRGEFVHINSTARPVRSPVRVAFRVVPGSKVANVHRVTRFAGFARVRSARVAQEGACAAANHPQEIILQRIVVLADEVVAAVLDVAGKVANDEVLVSEPRLDVILVNVQVRFLEGVDQLRVKGGGLANN